MSRSKPVAKEATQESMMRMLRRLTPRGPDGSGLWASPDGKVMLGHRRLAIIDTGPGGAQPMSLPGDDVVISFNGEIYNHRELRAGIETKGCRFHSTSDTEVLLHLWRQEGEGMLPRLRGMFAIALWDARSRSLLLARDPFGVKPLYYAVGGEFLRAASQVKALLAGGGIDTTPEPAGHTGFFLWGSVPEPYTLHRGIRALPAGTFLIAGPGGIRGPIPYEHVENSVVDPGKAGAVEPVPLRDALLDSVRHHLVSDVPVGLFLSAGIDSGVLLALATEIQGESIRTMTLGFEEYRGSPYDEVPLAETVAARCGARHTTVRVRREEFRDELPKLLDAMDQPSIDGVNTWFVSRAASSAGLKVALSGLGADELCGGYPGFREIPRSVAIFGPARRARLAGSAVRRIAATLVSHGISPKWAGVLEFGGTWAGAYLLRRGLYMPWELPGVMDTDIARAGLEELGPLDALEATAASAPTPWGKVQDMETAWYLRHQLLRDADWASMAHSLEVRVPYVDLPLRRAVWRNCAGGQPVGKREVAAVAAGVLPDALLSRPKSGFTVPLHEWTASMGKVVERGVRGWARQVYESFSGQ